MEKIQIPLVSICCQTYNHVSYIRECLEGFLLQKTNFPVEILIHDDASTDGTADIIREYESKYPDLIFPIYQTENQYSQGVRIPPINYRRARGKYIAFCEGDDYWTEPMKLQWQVDFMEANPEFVLTCHKFNILHIKTGTYSKGCGHKLVEESGKQGVEFDREFAILNWITQPLTIVFQKNAWDYQWCSEFKHPIDVHLIYSILSKGKGRYLNFEGAVYRIHENGISNHLNYYLIYKELYRKERTRATKGSFGSAYVAYCRMLLHQKKYLKLFVSIGRDEVGYVASRLLHYGLKNSIGKL